MLRRHELSTVDDLEAAALAAQTGLDLTIGPVIRAVLFATETARRLFLTAHHLVMDGVSGRAISRGTFPSDRIRGPQSDHSRGHAIIAYDRDSAPRYDYVALPFEADFLPSLSIRAAAAYLSVADGVDTPPAE